MILFWHVSVVCLVVEPAEDRSREETQEKGEKEKPEARKRIKKSENRVIDDGVNLVIM